MNGSPPKIEIFKPFEEAYELMLKILFRPFDFKKWCAIGFCAFLAGHFSAGGFSFPFPGNFPGNRPRPNVTMPDLSAWKPWAPIIVASCVLLFLGLIVLMMWLHSRANFMFTDCIVHNRGAVAAPWREYRQEGNSYFLFAMGLCLASMFVFACAGLLLFLLGVFAPSGNHSGTNPLAALFAVAGLMLLWFPISIFLSVIIYFMAPVMYIRRCRAVDAFREVFRLVTGRPMPFVLFCLFGIVLCMAMMMIGGMATCATCCLATLPYIGTVILLPVFVCLRAYSLCFLRQFGADYDVWSTLPQPEPTPPEPPPSQTEMPPLPPTSS